MSQKPILLKNATFINEGATSLRDILIKDNRIEKIDNFIINETKETPKQSCYGNC